MLYATEDNTGQAAGDYMSTGVVSRSDMIKIILKIKEHMANQM